MTLNKTKVKVHALFKEAKRLKKNGRGRIYVSRSTMSLFDLGTPVVWRVCMKFLNYDPMHESAIYSIYKQLSAMIMITAELLHYSMFKFPLVCLHVFQDTHCSKPMLSGNYFLFLHQPYMVTATM